MKAGDPMNILVIGRGGREHAIARQFNESDAVDTVYAAPGNDGMRKDAELVAIDEMDFAALADFAEVKAIDFTFVGPEQPLSEGIVDFFEERGLRIFGPSKAAAQIEASKSFAKELMNDYNIPTAGYATFTDLAEALAYIRKHGAPLVIKADGLAAGKGVVVAMTDAEAEAAATDMLESNRFAEAGSMIVVEEFLEGEEFSFMSFVWDGVIHPMVISQDHKRAYDDDEGPNTGGMGAYSPVPHIPDTVVAETYETVVKPAVSAMAQEGAPFNGILYTGVIWTAAGPKVIEFNARFGDPETQVVLPRMTTDFARFMQSLFEGQPLPLQWSDEAVVGVVVAAEGYPGTVAQGALVPEIPLQGGAGITYAGVKEQGGALTAAGGRVLLVSARGPSIEEAQVNAYRQLAACEWPGFFYRKDIGWRAIAKKV